MKSPRFSLSHRLWTILSLLSIAALSSACFADESADVEYLRVVTERAAKIVAPLSLPGAEQETRVRDIIAQQYVGLSKIHDGSDQLIKQLQEFCGDDQQAFDPAAQAIRNASEVQLGRLHREFIGKLSAELTPEQVDAVKDGLTYGVVPVTYKAYTDMLPDLTDEQKRAIKAWLVEAREHAMDAGSSEKKHWWFGKYKGRINNYLSAAGYNMKQAEKDWRQRLKAESQNKN